MLQRLRLRDFVIVDELEMEFAGGFTALSGETGAGKSILLDALGLLMGARADASVIREGASRADLSADFGIEPPIRAWLAERELAGDEGQLLLRRIIDADGRSRALINGHPATVAQLRELGDRLIDIHGQHAAQSMLRADGQRLLLDGVAGLTDAARSLATLHAAWRALENDLAAARANEREAELERERVEWRLGELAPLKPEPGEWDTLNAEHRRLSHAAALIDGARSAAQALSEEDDALTVRTHQIASRLTALAQHDAALAPITELLTAARIQLDEAASALSSYADRIDLDPQRLSEVDQRISALHAAARKFRLDPEQLADELLELRQRQRQLDEARDLARLAQRVDEAHAAYQQAAEQLSARRRAAARKLAQGVSRNIHGLGMAGGRFEIAIETVEPSASGIDRVEFRIAAHAGATPRPMAKVASGGELSRIGLAIATLAAQATPVPTLIFDEADAGVGGAVAEVIGRLMRELGQSRQVLCVTHLPQVAACAHQQFAVRKTRAGERTVSTVEALQRNERIEELARMLGGAQITQTVRRHARELLANAAAD